MVSFRVSVSALAALRGKAINGVVARTKEKLGKWKAKVTRNAEDQGGRHVYKY